MSGKSSSPCTGVASAASATRLSTLPATLITFSLFTRKHRRSLRWSVKKVARTANDQFRRKRRSLAPEILPMLEHLTGRPRRGFRVCAGRLTCNFEIRNFVGSRVGGRADKSPRDAKLISQRGLDEGDYPEGHMPLCFFHLNFGHRVLPDEEGVELPNRFGRPRGGVGSRARLGRSQDRLRYEALGELVLAGGRR